MTNSNDNLPAIDNTPAGERAKDVAANDPPVESNTAPEESAADLIPDNKQASWLRRGAHSG